MRRLLRSLIAATVLASSPVDAAWAQSRPAPPDRPVPAAPVQEVAPLGKVSVQVMVVYATESHSNVDSRLGKLASYLRNLRYTGYELISTESVSLDENGSHGFTLEGGRKVEVTLLSRDERRARMRVEVTSTKGGKLLDTTLSVNRNGTFIVAGPRYKDGILVLPLTARY